MGNIVKTSNLDQQRADVHVLIVDDNVDLAVTLGALFSFSGYTVTVEHSPVDALRIAQRERFDFCILDIGLPGMDGYELISRLKSLPNTCSAVYAAHSGYGSAECIRKSLLSGFTYHFTKPADVEQVLRACEKMAI